MFYVVFGIQKIGNKNRHPVSALTFGTHFRHPQFWQSIRPGLAVQVCPSISVTPCPPAPVAPSMLVRSSLSVHVNPPSPSVYVFPSKAVPQVRPPQGLLDNCGNKCSPASRALMLPFASLCTPFPTSSTLGPLHHWLMPPFTSPNPPSAY